MKCSFDFIFSLLIFIIVFPLLLIIALLIKITSKGPVFFTQRRIGKNRTEFCIYKFRTMYSNTPSDKATHLLKNAEKYITPIGRILRKTSLDELPQLINIFKGEMSFVGPRPALYNQYDLIELREKYGVNNIKPGITGWAQVNGRDELAIPVKVQYDKYYVDHYSLVLDLRILLLTLKNVILRKGIVEGTESNNQENIQM